MNKQDKIMLKKTLLPLKESMFPNQWESLTEEYPFIYQDDDDIEDDVEGVATPMSPINEIEVSKRALIERRNGASDSNVDESLHTFVDELDIPGLEITLSAARGAEYRMGLFLRKELSVLMICTAMRPHLLIMFAKPQEVPYLRSIGYVPFWETHDLAAKNSNQ